MSGINTKSINIKMKSLIDIEFGNIPSSFITFCSICLFVPAAADHHIAKSVVYRIFLIGEDAEAVENTLQRRTMKEIPLMPWNVK